jgi:RHS repeat-associated protein
MLVISIIVSFSLTGCDDIIAGITPTLGGGGSSSSVTTDTEGLPTLGTYYFHPDHVGSVSYLTDSEGAVVTRMSYTPYGEKIKSASTGPNIFHQKYTGQVDDGDEAELMYYNARYYDPKLGRFISADTIIPGAGFSQSFNRYMYVAGNPVNRNDPSGHWSVKGVFGKITSAITGNSTVNKIINPISTMKNLWNKTSNGAKNVKNWWINRGNDVKNYWNENQWLRITTYVAIIIVVVIVSILFAPAIYASLGITSIFGFSISGWIMLGCVAVGAGAGGLYFGTDGKIVDFVKGNEGKTTEWGDWKEFFKENWDWEDALKGAAIGSVGGLFIPAGVYIYNLKISIGGGWVFSLKDAAFVLKF